MSSRKPNKDEMRLHQAALENDRQEITAKEAEHVIPDSKSRQSALNFLLSVGLLKSLQDAKGKLVFRAVGKAELTATKDLTGEENLVLGHIKASKTEGLWTKHLKAKTNLHQTVIDRCLKTLTQKKLIKRVPSVQHPTRKIFMLEGYDPSVALTGGPWYTDGELDAEFIQTLSRACLKFIQDVTFPKKSGSDGQQKLYPVTQAPRYPSAETMRKTLRETRLTETELSVEHVEMLLNVLVLDGEIERIPAFGSALWDTQLMRTEDAEDEESDDGGKHKRRKHKYDSSDSDGPSERKRRRKKSANSEDRHRKRKRRASISSSSESEESSTQSRKKKRRAHSSDSERDSSSKPGKKIKKKRYLSNSSSGSEETRHPTKPKPKNENRSSSPIPALAVDFEDTGYSVYRALRPEQVSLGWKQSPCGPCSSFEFCKDGGLNPMTQGPVNPRECVYFKDWLDGTTVTAMEEDN